MSYTQVVVVNLGISKTGITDLRAQLFDSDGLDTGSELSGFVEIGGGAYSLEITLDDLFKGGIYFYQDAAPSTILSSGSVNPLNIVTTGIGPWSINFQVYETATTTPIENVQITVKSDTATVAQGVTDALGQLLVGLENSTYTVYLIKSGYIFSIQTLTVVDADIDPQIYYGQLVAFPAAPTHEDDCRVIIPVGGTSGLDTFTADDLTATLKIVDLPYDSSGRFYIGDEVDFSFDVGNQYVYWDVVRGATVKIEMDSHGVDKRIHIPDDDYYYVK